MRMKKQYEAPKAKKVEFSYEENVTASITNVKTGSLANCWPWEVPTCKDIPNGGAVPSDQE